MSRILILSCMLLGLLLNVSALRARDADPQAAANKMVRIGAVAYSPAVVTVFQDLKDYLNARGFANDYVLYSNYDSLVTALENGEVEIAWNTPLAHGRYHVRNNCASQTLVMRDVDHNVHSVLIARVDGGVEELAQLTNKKIVLGSLQAAEATVLPLHYLKQEGIQFADENIVSLDQEVDSEGNPCASPQHVLQAVLAGRGDAGIITAGLWNRVKNQPGMSDKLRLVWTSPAFSHCVFTAAPGFNEELGDRFRELMLGMDPKDPEAADIMRLEGTRKWLPGSPDGFQDLVDALNKQ